MCAHTASRGSWGSGASSSEMGVNRRKMQVLNLAGEPAEVPMISPLMVRQVDFMPFALDMDHADRYTVLLSPVAQ